MKKIFLFFLFYFALLGARDEMGRWCLLETLTNENPTYPMKMDIRWNELEDITQSYGWRWGDPWPKISGGDFIHVGQTITIKPNESLNLQNTVIPQVGSKGHLSEKRIQLKGIGEQTTEEGGPEYFEISPGKLLKLDSLRGKAFAWFVQPISNRAIAFWGQTEGKLVIAIGSKMGPNYLIKIILGQKKSKIITKEEEEAEQAITDNNEALIKYGDKVIIQNIKTGKILSFNPNKNLIESSTYSANLEKLPKNKVWEINQTYKPYKQEKSEDDFLENGETIALFTNDKYLSGRFGGAITLEPKTLAWEKWTIQKIDSSDSRIKNGDEIMLLSAHEASYLVLNSNGIAENRWPMHNDNNIWKIRLVKTPEQKIYKSKYPQITKEENSKAMATTGFDGVYWISIIDNYVFVGSGYKPGENLFLFRILPKKFAGQMNYIGFGCRNKPALYSNILLSEPINKIIPEGEYASLPPIALTDNFKILKAPLRIPTKGSISFDVKSQGSISVGFFKTTNPEDIEYKIVIGKDNNTSIAIYDKNDEKTYLFKNYPIENDILSYNNFDNFIVSINDGLITVFKNDDLLLAWQDPHPAQSYKYVGLSSTDDQAKIRKIRILDPVEIEAQRTERAYREKAKDYQSQDTVQLKLVAPYTYWLRQSGFNLEIEDPVYKNKTWKLSPPLEKMGEHAFKVTISKSGKPDIQYMREAAGHPLEKILNIGANVLGNTGTALANIPNPKVQAAGLITGVVGGTLESITKAIFAPIKGIYTEEARIAQAESYESSTVVKNTQEIKKILEEFDKIRDIRSETELEYGIEWHHEILDKIINPDNATSDIKQKILRNLDTLKSKVNKILIIRTNADAELYNSFISLLIKAYDNLFLFDKEQKQDLYNQINELTVKLFDALKTTKLEFIKLPPCHGEYIWYPDSFKTPDKGTVFFKASGDDNIILGFSDKKTQVRYLGRSKEIYQIIIGGWQNKITAICADSDAWAIVNHISSKKNPTAMAPFTDFRQYWISINNGHIVFGIIENNKVEKILEWQDPYPRTRFRYVGFSNWNHPIRLKDIILKDIAFNDPDFINVAEEIARTSKTEISKKPRSVRRPVEVEEKIEEESDIRTKQKEPKVKTQVKTKKILRREKPKEIE
ncbi:MAG: hypothetical protein WC436_02425 [Candidatus Babeliales bacterium]